LTKIRAIEDARQLFHFDQSISCRGPGLAATWANYSRVELGLRRRQALMVLIVGDGSGKLSSEISRRKAYTSASLRVSTMDFNKRVAGVDSILPFSIRNL
jgi:hypothetical protein